MKTVDFDICEDCPLEFACHARGVRCYTDDIDDIIAEDDWYERI